MSSPGSPGSPAYYGGGESKRDRRKRDIAEHLDRISNEFLTNRNSYFRQVLSDLQVELQELHNGTHPELIAALSQLEEEYNER